MKLCALILSCIGACGLAGFTHGCCDSEINDTKCLGATGECFCDQSCYRYGNCCEDIKDIECLPGQSVALMYYNNYMNISYILDHN